MVMSMRGPAQGGFINRTHNGNDMTWTLASNGIDINASTGIAGLITDSSGNLYARTAYYKIYKSSDSGKTWNLMSLPTDEWNRLVPADSMMVDGNTFYVGTSGNVYRTSDGGLNWQSLNPDDESSNSVVSVAVLNGMLYIATDGALYKTPVNKVQPWINIRSNLPPSLLYMHKLIAVNDGKPNGLLYVATSQGLYVTSNGGQSWLGLNHDLPKNIDVRDVIVHGATLIISTSNGGVYLSKNSGENWSAVNDGLQDMNVAALANNNNYVFTGFLAGIYRMNSPF